jgi:hypothetical protein
VSRDSVAEEAHERSGTVLNVLVNHGHGEGTDRGARVVIPRCEPLFCDAPLAAGLLPKQDGSGVLEAVLAADLIRCEEARKSAE